jgi:hypothetical protein
LGLLASQAEMLASEGALSALHQAKLGAMSHARQLEARMAREIASGSKRDVRE